MALMKMSAWFGAYSSLSETECMYRFGESKNGEGFFAVYGPEDLDEPVEPSNLATYLHEDPTYFRNNQLDV